MDTNIHCPQGESVVIPSGNIHMLGLRLVAVDKTSSKHRQLYRSSGRNRTNAINSFLYKSFLKIYPKSQIIPDIVDFIEWILSN